jgi:hypothetical protein
MFLAYLRGSRQLNATFEAENFLRACATRGLQTSGGILQVDVVEDDRFSEYF